MSKKLSWRRAGCGKDAETEAAMAGQYTAADCGQTTANLFAECRRGCEYVGASKNVVQYSES
jgi:hypothetical protein